MGRITEFSSAYMMNEQSIQMEAKEVEREREEGNEDQREEGRENLRKESR